MKNIFSMAGAGLLAGCTGVTGQAEEAKKQPNFLFIMVDDLGHGDLGCTGHPFVSTPNIDGLAKDGVVMQNFYAAHPICSPSRASIMAGRMPYRLGIYSFIYYGGDYVHLKAKETTFPQLLRKGGYQTSLIGKWHASHNDVQQKFKLPTMKEYGYDYWYSSDNNTIIKDKPGWWDNGKQVGKRKGLAANVVGDETVKWLEKHRDPNKPFMLSMHFYEPHWLLVGPDKLVKKYQKHYDTDKQRAHFPAAVENVDNEIGRVLGKLKELGLEEDTVVIFTSDNGPANFGKDRAHDRNDGRAEPYKGYKYGLWNGSVQVPGIVRWPGVVKAGSKITEPTGHLDLFPTLCSIAGVKVPEKLNIDGTDISALLKGEDRVERSRPLQWHYYNSTLKDKTCPRAFLRHGDFVLCGYYDSQKTIGRGRWYPKHMPFLKNQKLVKFELYNLVKDPKQTTDVSASHPELFQKLQKQLTSGHTELQSEAYGWEKEFQALNEGKKKGKKKKGNKKKRK